MFDYSELLGKIKSVYKTQEAFSLAMGMSLASINQRLNNKVNWTSVEIMRACEILFINADDISKYFFTQKVK